MRRCAACGVQVGPWKRFCASCFTKRRKEADTKRGQHAREVGLYRTSTCLTCHAPIRPNKTGQCFACITARSSAACAQCGVTFWPWGRDGKTPRLRCDACLDAWKTEAIARKAERARKQPRQKLSLEERRERDRQRSAKKYAADVAKARARVLAYKRQHPEKNREWGHRRRVRMAAGYIEPVDIGRVARSRRTCFYCGGGITTSSATVDHIIPVARGGEHSARNLVACCSPCNSRKSDKSPAEWIQTLAPRRRTVVEREIARRCLHDARLPLVVGASKWTDALPIRHVKRAWKCGCVPSTRHVCRWHAPKQAGPHSGPSGASPCG